MEKTKLVYIWLDGNKTQDIRSKVKIISKSFDEVSNMEISELPMWSFDGSSTNQAKGNNSDCYLKPVSIYNNPLEENSHLILCEVLNEDGSPHVSNTRDSLVRTANEFQLEKPWFGIEQEFFLFKDQEPLGWNFNNDSGPQPQGPYYCGVGGGKAFGREISIKHADACIKAGLEICGTNAEVAPGQWEYQIGPLPPIEMGDQLWISRYLLHIISESYNVEVVLDPKPIIGDWNGSGGHTNYSTAKMRAHNGLKEILSTCDKLEKKHAIHMESYGENNIQRMTGKHETSGYYNFKTGNSDRGCSIRIPLQTRLDKRGYMEDRRPAANLDPYTVCRLILETTLG